MVEYESEFYDYLIKIRNGLKLSDVEYYLYLLRQITEELPVDIIAVELSNIENVKNLERALKVTSFDEKTKKICSKALRSYSRFSKKISTDKLNSNQFLSYLEGGTISVKVNRYERNVNAREECIAYHGAQCKVCGFDFFRTYGEIGKGFIHVHHVIPLSEIKKEYEVNPINDLVPVCPNCHSMLHRRVPPYTVVELKEKHFNTDK